MLFVRLTWSDTDLLLFFFISFHFLFFTCSHCRTQSGSDLSLFFSFSFFTSFSSHWALSIRLLPHLSFHQFLIPPSPRCTCYTLMAPCYTCYIPVTPSYTHVTLCTWEHLGWGSNILTFSTASQNQKYVELCHNGMWNIWCEEYLAVRGVNCEVSEYRLQGRFMSPSSVPALPRTTQTTNTAQMRRNTHSGFPSRFMKWDNPLVLE